MNESESESESFYSAGESESEEGQSDPEYNLQNFIDDYNAFRVRVRGLTFHHYLGLMKDGVARL